MTTPSAQVCECGIGPNVARCRAGHLEPTKARDRTECPHRENGIKCGQRSNVLKASRTLTEVTTLDSTAARFWEEVPDWAGGVLMRKNKNAVRCRHCESAAPLWADSGRTLLFCRNCRRIDDYPEVREWRSRQHGDENAPAVRQITAADRAWKADDERRELRFLRRNRVDQLKRVLADKRLADRARSDVEDFLEQYNDDRMTFERFSELEDQLKNYIIQRKSLLARRTAVDRYDETDDEVVEGEVVEGEIVNEDQDDEEGQPGGWRPVPVRGMSGILVPFKPPPGDVYNRCAFCQDPGRYRVSTAQIAAQQLAAIGGTLPVIVCAGCWPKVQKAAGPVAWQIEDLVRRDVAVGRRPALPAASPGYAPCPCGKAADPRNRTSSPDGRTWCAGCSHLLESAAPDRAQQPNPVITVSGYEPRQRRRLLA